MLGRVHADEALALQPLRRVLDRDAAELGRIDPVVHLDLHDVLILADGPIGSVAALPAVMYRSLPAQPLEIGIPSIVLIELRVADIDRLERDRIGVMELRRHYGASRPLSAGPAACGRPIRRAPRASQSDRPGAN